MNSSIPFPAQPGALTLGMIGLGKMGLPMAKNLLDCGFPLVGLDLNSVRTADLCRLGGEAAESPSCVALRSSVVMLSLPDAPSLREVVFGEGGILSCPIEGKVFIDTTTATRTLTLEIAEAVSQRGGSWLDAPVTGGVGGAEAGSLTFFIGGDSEALKRCEPIFECLGAHAVYMGPSGMGQLTKMVKQILGSARYCVAAEAYGFAREVGLDMTALVEALGAGNALTQFLHLRESGSYGDEGYTAQRGKDLDYAREEALQRGLYAPLTLAMAEMFDRARMAGLGEAEPSALFLLWDDDAPRPKTKEPVACT